MTPPINPPTHPPNNTPTHGWGSLHRFQIFKWNWNISISSSAIEFWLIPGVPRVGGGGVDVIVMLGEFTCEGTFPSLRGLFCDLNLLTKVCFSLWGDHFKLTSMFSQLIIRNSPGDLTWVSRWKTKASAISRLEYIFIRLKVFDPGQPQ